MARSGQISLDLVKDWMHAGKGKKVVSTVAVRFLAGAPSS